MGSSFCPGTCYALLNPNLFLESEKLVSFEDGLLKRRTECSGLIFKWIFFAFNLPEEWRIVILTLKTSTASEGKTHKVWSPPIPMCKKFNS